MMIILGGGLLLLGLLTWFYLLEIDGRRHTIFVVLAVVFIVEAMIAGGGASVPVGILRPQFGGQDFRPPDLIIVAAGGAHLLAARAGRIGPLTFAWFPFVSLYGAGVVIGLMNDQPIDIVLFEGKTLFYLVGGALIAAGADLERLVPALGKIGLVLAPAVPIALFMRTAGLELTVSTPVQRLDSLGKLSNDTITILVGLGGIVIIAEAVRVAPSYLRLGAGVVMLFAPIAAAQRASYLSLAGVLSALLVLVAGRTWRTRSNVGPLQLGMVAAVLTAVLLTGYLASDSSSVVVSSVEDAFGGIGNQESAEARSSLYDEAFAQIGDNPIFGTGVGAQVTTIVPSGELTTPAHNIALEMLMRVGVVGLVALLIALSVTWIVSVRVWRWADRAHVAAVGASTIVAFAAVLPKAMVEPALSKFRLALFLGIALGCLAASERTIDALVARRRRAAADPTEGWFTDIGAEGTLHRGEAS